MSVVIKLALRSVPVVYSVGCWAMQEFGRNSPPNNDSSLAGCLEVANLEWLCYFLSTAWAQTVLHQ